MKKKEWLGLLIVLVVALLLSAVIVRAMPTGNEVEIISGEFILDPNVVLVFASEPSPSYAILVSECYTISIYADTIAELRNWETRTCKDIVDIQLSLAGETKEFIFEEFFELLGFDANSINSKKEKGK